MPRKGENIYKRKDGRWEGHYIKGRTPEGKALYGYLYAHNYYDLKQKLRKCLQEQKGQTEINKDSVTDSIEFKKISETWLNSTKPQIKDSTYAKYANLLNTYIFPYFGDQLIEDINYENIEYFSTQMLTQGGRTSNGLSAKTVNDCLVLIRTILAYAANHGCKPQCSGNQGNYQTRCQRSASAAEGNPAPTLLLLLWSESHVSVFSSGFPASPCNTPVLSSFFLLYILPLLFLHLHAINLLGKKFC